MWNCRVIKTVNRGEVSYGIHEVFYTNNGEIYGYTVSPVEVLGESLEALKEYVQWMQDCLEKPVLVDGEVKFADLMPERSKKMKIFDKKNMGFMVSFNWIVSGGFRGDYFPNPWEGEALIPTEKEAWELARNFAELKKGKIVDVYVVDADFRPVKGYLEKCLLKNNRKE